MYLRECVTGFNKRKECSMKRVTNANFMKNDQRFRAACEVAGVEITKRQASKFRRRVGRAWLAGKFQPVKVNDVMIGKLWKS